MEWIWGLKKELDAGLCLPAVFRPALGEVLTALARDKLVPFVTHQRNDKKIWIRVLRILESSVASEKRQSFRGGAPKPDPASPGRAPAAGHASASATTTWAGQERFNVAST